MKVPLEWLGDYIEISEAPEKIADILSDLGFACDGIQNRPDGAVLDVEVTSNRPDCLGLIGIARELAAVTGRRLRVPDVKLACSERDVSDLAGVENRQSRLCGRYTARVIEGARVGPSPGWLRRRLEAAGLRSVNNAVDAANYAMLETAQPPHAFDYEKLSRGRIIIRKARAGEVLVAIDGTKCQLDSETLIIADFEKPVAVAGVMGSADTEVGESTKTILVEDAFFDPVTVRTAARRLCLSSEASFRFERRVDIENIEWASRRTCQLIAAVCGGRAAAGVIDVYSTAWSVQKVSLRCSRLKQLLGIDIPNRRVKEILCSLGFECRLSKQGIDCKVPSWRSDVCREVDLIEEVGRVYGYDKLPTGRKIPIEVVPVDGRRKALARIGAYLNGCGFHEAITVGFTEAVSAGLFALPDSGDGLAVHDVQGRRSSLLRQSLVGSLLGVLKTNLNAGNLPCRIFEIADVFLSAPGGSRFAGEQTRLAIACDGDFRVLVGVIQGLVKHLDRTAEAVLRPADLKWAKPGAEVFLAGRVVGVAGVVCERAAKLLGLKRSSPVAAELIFDRICDLAQQGSPMQPVPKYPAVQRDLTVVIDEKMTWQRITEAVGELNLPELDRLDFAGIYRGCGVPSGSKSVTLSLRFRSDSGTLTHEQVDRLQDRVIESLRRRTGAELRVS